MNKFYKSIFLSVAAVVLVMFICSLGYAASGAIEECMIAGACLINIAINSDLFRLAMMIFFVSMAACLPIIILVILFIGVPFIYLSKIYSLVSIFWYVLIGIFSGTVIFTLSYLYKDRLDFLDSNFTFIFVVIFLSSITYSSSFWFAYRPDRSIAEKI